MLSEIQEIQEAIEDAKEQQAQLEAALSEAKVAARDHIVQTVRAMIDESGFTPDEILPLVAPQPSKPARSGDGRAFPTYAMKSDPTVTYRRGVLPEKLKDAMQATGFDPSQGADRAKFKAEYMVQV